MPVEFTAPFREAAGLLADAGKYLTAAAFVLYSGLPAHPILAVIGCITAVGLFTASAPLLVRAFVMIENAMLGKPRPGRLRSNLMGLVCAVMILGPIYAAFIALVHERLPNF